MTNRYGVRDAAAQLLAVARLRAAGYDARPVRRAAGYGVGIAGASSSAQVEAASLLETIDVGSYPWPPAEFVR